jgi:hypothetical protein
MVSKGTKMRKQGTAGKSKHVTLMMPQKLKIIKRRESSKTQREVMASYAMGSLTTVSMM